MFKLSSLMDYAIVLSIAAAAYFAHNSIVRERAIANLITESKAHGAKKAKRSREIRETNKPGAAARLRQRHCRDCDWRVRVKPNPDR